MPVDDEFRQKSASFVMAWGVTWRLFASILLLYVPLYFVPRDIYEKYPLLGIILLAIGIFIVMWAWIYRILRKGLGKVDINFVVRE